MFPVTFEVFELGEYLTCGLLYYYDTVYFGASLQNFKSTCCWKYILENGSFWNTGRFVMFSMITNFYNKKTKRTPLVELFTATGKLKKFFFFLSTTDVRCVHYRWHGTHRYDIQVLATHASTWVHRYSSLLRWSVPLGQRSHMAIRIICTKFTLHSNHRHNRVIFQHTKRLLPRSGHFITTYTRIA